MIMPPRPAPQRMDDQDEPLGLHLSGIQRPGPAVGDRVDIHGMHIGVVIPASETSVPRSRAPVENRRCRSSRRYGGPGRPGTLLHGEADLRLVVLVGVGGVSWNCASDMRALRAQTRSQGTFTSSK
jgi:hypothetical protein